MGPSPVLRGPVFRPRPLLVPVDAVLSEGETLGVDPGSAGRNTHLCKDLQYFVVTLSFRTPIETISKTNQGTGK